MNRNTVAVGAAALAVAASTVAVSAAAVSVAAAAMSVFGDRLAKHRQGDRLGDAVAAARDRNDQAVEWAEARRQNGGDPAGG